MSGVMTPSKRPKEKLLDSLQRHNHLFSSTVSVNNVCKIFIYGCHRIKMT